MLNSDLKQHASMREKIEDRRRYAANDPEETYYRNLVSGRQAATSMLLWPLMNFEKGFLYYTMEKDPITGVLTKVIKKDNPWIVGYRQLNMLLVKSWGAEYLRAYSDGYNVNQDYLRVNGAAQDIAGLLSSSARHFGEESLANRTKKSISTPVGRVFKHASDANMILQEFMHGKMPLSPTRAQSLYDTLKGFSDTYESMADHVKDLHGHALEHMDLPSDAKLFSAIVKEGKVETLEEAERVLALSQGLLHESAVPLNTMDYIPQPELVLDRKEAMALANHLHMQMSAMGLSLNQTSNGIAYIPNLPPHSLVVVRQGRARPVTKQEMIAVGQKAAHFIHHNFANKLDAIDHYIEHSQQDIRQNLAGTQKESEREKSFVSELTKQTLQSPSATTLPQTNLLTPQTQVTTPQHVGHSVTDHISAFAKHVSRPEMLNDSGKLYGRKFANYVQNVPLAMIGNMLLGFTKKDAAGKQIPVNLKSLRKHGLGLLITRDNLKASAYMLAAYPIVESLGINTILSGIQYQRQFTLKDMDQSNKILDETFHSGWKRFPSVAEKFSRIANAGNMSSLLKEHPELNDMLKDAELANHHDATPEQITKGYHAMAAFFEKASQAVLDESAKAVAPLVTSNDGKVEPFDARVRDVAFEPIRTTEDAMLFLSLLRVANRLGAPQITSIEYVDPFTQLMDAKGYQLANQLLHQQSGTLQKGGELAFISAAESLRNALEKSWNKTAIDHVMSLEHGPAIGLLEQYLFEQEIEKGPQADNQDISTTLTQPWANAPKKSKLSTQDWINDAKQHALRPESKHEMNKLFKRQFYSEGTYVPFNMSENFLWGHSLTENALNALWRWASYTLSFSFGSVFIWQFLNFRSEQVREGASETSQLIGDVVHKTMKLFPDAAKELAGSEAMNTTLLRLENTPYISAIPAILSRQPSDRTREQTQALNQFNNEYFRAFTENVVDSIKGNDDHHMDIQQILANPTDKLSAAIMKLSVVDSILAHDLEYIGIIRFEDPNEKLLDKKQIEELSNFIASQTAASGVVDNGSPTKEDVIRLANVVSDKCYQLIAPKMEKSHTSELRRRYLADAQKDIGKS